MDSHGSRRVIVAALAGNALIAVTKFLDRQFGKAERGRALGGRQRQPGPHALRYETGRAAGRCAASLRLRAGARFLDLRRRHPVFFAGGAGVSIYEGIDRVRRPQAYTDAWINHVVLAAALLFEGAVWMVAFREFSRTRKRGVSVMNAVRASKDPTVFIRSRYGRVRSIFVEAQD